MHGVQDDSDEDGASAGAGAWRAIKEVWASKWTERAWLSRRAAGVNEDDLSMAVLCMGLVPADYAFVLHTQSPLPGGSKDEIFGEVRMAGRVLGGCLPAVLMFGVWCVWHAACPHSFRRSPSCMGLPLPCMTSRSAADCAAHSSYLPMPTHQSVATSHVHVGKVCNHFRNPVQVVIGLGETLVGNTPGRAFSFAASKRDPQATARILALPSKLAARFAPPGGALIARSDSNGEDLEGFAGAGLYESVATRKTRERAVEYAGERLLWDPEFRDRVAARLAGLAVAVEQAAGSAQDIEGCLVGDEVYLLQSRTQV